MQTSPRFAVLIGVALFPFIVISCAVEGSYPGGKNRAEPRGATGGGLGSGGSAGSTDMIPVEGGGTGGGTESAGAGGAVETGGSGGTNNSGGAGNNAKDCSKWLGGTGATSEWVRVGPDGKLVYKTLNAHGDRIIDFSYVGYMGGGVRIPDVPTKVTVSPGDGDDTKLIQDAINTAGNLPLTNGIRGAVLLKPGTYQVSATLRVGKTGVVLRGSGSGTNGTIIEATGTGFNMIWMSGTATLTPDTTAQATITDSYVPSGANSFTVNSAAKFKVGDNILVRRPVTDKWVHFMRMDTLVRDGVPQTWLAPPRTHDWQRTITNINGNKITIDVPVSDSFDANYVTPPGASIVKYTLTGFASQIGVEHIRFTSPPRSADLENYLLRLDDMQDGWVRDVTGNNFTRGVITQPLAKRVTIEDVVLTHDPNDYFTSAAPFDFSVNSQLVLVHRSSSTGGNKIWYFATQNLAQGPNVVLNFTASGDRSHLSPHQRWATGLLVDSSQIGGQIMFTTNGTAGDGYGWDIGWGVAWNCTANMSVLQPPGATNWAIGCKGAQYPAATDPTTGAPEWPMGTYDSHGVPVQPSSLYLAQLCERLGPQAVANIGY